MAGKLGILFLHHDTDAVTMRNLSSIRAHNPEATIVTMSAREPLPSGYSLDDTPEIKKLHQRNIARGSDRLVCSWFVQRKEKCDKWWIVEWDTFCRTSVQKHYKRVWDLPFVASCLILPHREPTWFWFRDREKMSGELQPYAIGAVPFLYLMSEVALSATCAMLLAKPLLVGNGELRFATAANKCGYPPCGYSPPNDQISWIPLKNIGDQAAIFHPVKHVVCEQTCFTRQHEK